MTANQTRDKMRAVFLAALMVFSVFGGAIAFTGTAAANVSSLDMETSGNSDVVQSTDTIWVEGNAGNADDITFEIEDSDGDSASTTKSIESSGLFTLNIDLSKLTFDGGEDDGLSEGDVTIEATQDSSDDPAIAQFKVDDTSPANPISTSGDAISSTNENPYSVTVNLTDDHEAGDVTVQLDDGTNQISTTTSVSAESDSNSYEHEVGLDIDASSLNEGSVDISAKIIDNAGNENPSGFAAESTVTKDTSVPTINDFSVTQQSGEVKIAINSSEQLGSADGDIEVEYQDESGTNHTLDGSDFTESASDGGSYVYTYTTTAFEGDHIATLNTAQDSVENNGASGEVDSVTVGTAPTYLNYDPKDEKISDDEHPITVDISDTDGVNPDNIQVEIYNESAGLVSSNTPSDAGVYFDGATLSVYPGSDGVSTLPDGTVWMNVTASDSNGNYNKAGWSFTVDASGPQVTPGTADGSYVTTTEPTLTFDLTDKHSSVNPNTVEVTIEDASGDVLLDSATDSTAGVEYDGRTLTVDSSMSEVPELPQEDVTYIVTAADSEDNLNSSAFTYTIDSAQPEVTSVSVDDTPVTDASGTRDVTIDLSEPMDQTNKPSVKIDVDGDGTPEDTVSANSTFGTNGFGPANTTWKGTVTLTSKSADATAEVEMTSASDKAGNAINTSENNGTFDYDTISPTVETNFTTDETQNGTANVTQLFDVTNDADDIADATYEYNTNSSGGFPADDYQEITSTESFDTEALEEGQIDLKVTVEDDVGNNDTANDTVIIDNVNPAVTSNLDEGEKVYGTVNLTEEFDLTDADSVTYEYNDSGAGWVSVDNAPTEVYNAETNEINTTELSDSTDGTLGLRVKVTDAAGTEANTTVNVSVNNIDIQDFSAEGVEDENNVTVSFASNANLSDASLVISQDDSYLEDVEDVELTLDDFDEVENGTTNTFNYTATVELPRDGSYVVDFDSANATDGQRLVDSTVSDGANVDAEDPRVIDAQIIGANDTSTQIRVEFNEPVSTSLGKTVIGDDRANSSELLTDDSDAAGGYVVFNVSDQFQTGDSPDLNVSDEAFNEKYSVETQNATNASDTTTVHTLELELKEGHNVVSVPAASGSFDLSSLSDEQLSAIDTVWTYEDGDWQSYVPDDNQSDFTALEGGQGYIFVMDSDATVDVNVYNQPGGDTVESSLPQSQDLDEGWNLVGHWQEGSQDKGVALKSIEGSYDSVIEQTENGRLSFNAVTDTETLDPGEGYWISVTEEGEVYTEHAWATS